MEVNGLPSYELEINRRTQGCKFPILTPILKAIWMVKEYLAFRMADKIIVVTDGLLETLRNEYKVSEKKINVVPNGVDPTLFGTECTSNARPVVLFASAFLPHRETDRIVNIAAKVLKSRVEAEFHLVGEGPDLSKIKERVGRMSISSKFRFTGNTPHNEMTKLIAESDICVYDYLKNDWEYYRKIGICPLKILEYMAAGKPVVSLRFKGLPTRLAEAEAGVVVDSTDAMAEAIIRLARNREEILSLGRKARSLAQSEYAWDVVSQKILSVCAEQP